MNTAIQKPSLIDMIRICGFDLVSPYITEQFFPSPDSIPNLKSPRQIPLDEAEEWVKKGYRHAMIWELLVWRRNDPLWEYSQFRGYIEARGSIVEISIGNNSNRHWVPIIDRDGGAPLTLRLAYADNGLELKGDFHQCLMVRE